MCNVRFSNFGGQTKQESKLGVQTRPYFENQAKKWGQTKQESKLGVQTSSYFENQAKNQGQTTSESRIEAKNQGQTKSESKKGVQTRPYFENQAKKWGQTKQESKLGVQSGLRSLELVQVASHGLYRSRYEVARVFTMFRGALLLIKRLAPEEARTTDLRVVGSPCYPCTMVTLQIQTCYDSRSFLSLQYIYLDLRLDLTQGQWHQYILYVCVHMFA